VCLKPNASSPFPCSIHQVLPDCFKPYSDPISVATRLGCHALGVPHITRRRAQRLPAASPNRTSPLLSRVVEVKSFAQPVRMSRRSAATTTLPGFAAMSPNATPTMYCWLPSPYNPLSFPQFGQSRQRHWQRHWQWRWPRHWQRSQQLFVRKPDGRLRHEQLRVGGHPHGANPADHELCQPVLVIKQPRHAKRPGSTAPAVAGPSGGSRWSSHPCRWTSTGPPRSAPEEKRRPV
jgi:hypothetical protein